MKKIFSIIAASLMLTSCVDTVLLPDDKTVDEDFWKTKSEVSQMVGGAYQAMTSSNIIQRLIVWGDFRSDELTQVSGISNSTYDALNEINAVNIQTTNTYAKWADFYNVINDCNVVLDKAEGVMKIDPNYTEGDYLSDRSQMLALRSLCYFILVRNFRDVPYITTAYMNSSQPMDLPQAAPDSVLQGCINDLTEAEQNALDPTAYSNWRRVGFINRDAIDAILADIYLWRASVHHSASDYQQCINYCDKVIASKKANHVPGINETTPKEYPLADGEQAYNDIFVTQNAEESIFELQFDGDNNSNSALCQMYYKYNSNTSASGYMNASSVVADQSGSGLYSRNGTNPTTSDYRRNNSIYADGKGTFYVRKMIAQAGITGNPANAQQKREANRSNGSFAQNYIFYRLSDIMLMKAEALTALSTTDGDPQLYQAFKLVQAVNNRSLYTPGDSLQFAYYRTPANMETLVMNERLRELCFEGKRWYDLMRYNYRHITASDYSKTFYQLSQESYNFPRNYDAMLNLVTRKLTDGAEAAKSKMKDERYLYMPINHSDIVVNYNLHQNPAYSDEDEFQKQ